MRSEPDRSIRTGKIRTSPTKEASPTGAYGNRLTLARPRRKPTPMPRKDPSSTKLLKYERWTMFEPVQRMSASSTKSIRQLRRIRRRDFDTADSLGAPVHQPHEPIV